MTPRFTYDDKVTVSTTAAAEMRPGAKAWIIAVLEKERVPTYRKFHSDVVYAIEFEDGSAIDIEECFLEPFSD